MCPAPLNLHVDPKALLIMVLNTSSASQYRSHFNDINKLLLESTYQVVTRKNIKNRGKKECYFVF